VVVVGDDTDHLIIIGDSKITRGSVSVTVLVTIPRPNRYSFGVLVELPVHYHRGFAYKNGLLGWGLHDHPGSLGIFCQTQLIAPSTLGYTTGDYVSPLFFSFIFWVFTPFRLSPLVQVTCIVDVDKGHLSFKVNGVPCAELVSCEVIKLGVYIAATLFNHGAVWKITDSSRQV
jgi:hypothetical protein